MEFIGLLAATVVIGWGFRRATKSPMSGRFGSFILLAAYLAVFAWAALLIRFFTR